MTAEGPGQRAVRNFRNRASRARSPSAPAGSAGFSPAGAAVKPCGQLREEQSRPNAPESLGLPGRRDPAGFQAARLRARRHGAVPEAHRRAQGRPDMGPGLHRQLPRDLASYLRAFGISTMRLPLSRDLFLVPDSPARGTGPLKAPRLGEPPGHGHQLPESWSTCPTPGQL